MSERNSEYVLLPLDSYTASPTGKGPISGDRPYVVIHAFRDPGLKTCVPSVSFRTASSTDPRKVVQVTAAGLSLLLTACGRNVEDPKIELNPHPKMHYAITVNIENAPGPFDSVEASADYSVTDYACVLEQPTSGARILPNKHIELKLRQVSATTYETDMYVDLLKDKDFFSQGVCRWSEASFSVFARHGRMTFMTPLPNFRYPADGAEVRYFSFAAYQKSTTDMLNTGNKNRDAYDDSSKTFSIRVDAKEMR